jgi:hypothetical protein
MIFYLYINYCKKKIVGTYIDVFVFFLPLMTANMLAETRLVNDQ